MQAICKYFGAELPVKMPSFWIVITNTIKFTEADINDMYRSNVDQKPVNFNVAMDIITSLQLIETVVSFIHADIIEQVFTLLPTLETLLKHPLKAVG